MYVPMLCVVSCNAHSTLHLVLTVVMKTIIASYSDVRHCMGSNNCAMYLQVDGPDILPDDVVRVIDDMAEVHRLQQAGRGWEDDMALVSLVGSCNTHPFTHTRVDKWTQWRAATLGHGVLGGLGPCVLL